MTRFCFMYLRRLPQEALRVGELTPELQKARAENVTTFTHFLDLPILFLIVALGTLRPDDWRLFAVGSLVAVAVVSVLTLLIPRLYPWAAKQ